MDLPTVLAEIEALSVDERIRLVQAVWDRIADEEALPELTEAQRRELDRRLAAHAASPGDVLTWEQIKAHVRGEG